MELPLNAEIRPMDRRAEHTDNRSVESCTFSSTKRPCTRPPPPFSPNSRRFRRDNFSARNESSPNLSWHLRRAGKIYQDGTPYVNARVATRVTRGGRRRRRERRSCSKIYILLSVTLKASSIISRFLLLVVRAASGTTAP